MGWGPRETLYHGSHRKEWGRQVSRLRRASLIISVGLGCKVVCSRVPWGR